MMMTFNSMGLHCTGDDECRIAKSTCSQMGYCECHPGMFYDRDLRACVRVMEYNEACIPDLADECRNDHMTCSDLGICKCETGFSYVPGFTPFCQPGNASACPLGQIWSDIRSQCIVRPVDVWVESGAYDRNRYSLFFAVLLILILMVILFKSKKPHPNPFPFSGRPVSQHSCPDPYDADLLSIDELEIRLAEAGLVRFPSPRRLHHHPRIPNLSESSDGYCVAYQPPPSYSSTLNLNRMDRREKPPPYEEAIRMADPHQLNQVTTVTGMESHPMAPNDVTVSVESSVLGEEQESVEAATLCPDTRIPIVVHENTSDDAATKNISEKDASQEEQC